MTGSNPFATRFVAPGKVPWISASESELPTLAARFQELHRRAAIVGPHGSGKSTLLEYLVPCVVPESVSNLDGADWHNVICFQCDPSGAFSVPEKAKLRTNGPKNAGGSVVWLRLRKGPKLVENLRRAAVYFEPGRLLVLDGYEQLTLAQSLWIRWRVRWNRMGLLVTSHRKIVGLATLCRTKVDARTAHEIAEYLLAQQGVAHFPESSIAALEARLKTSSGNLREVLMDLYDVYQSRMGENKPQ